MTDSNIERALGWDEGLPAPVEWTPLPEGEYDFEVIKFERGRYEPKPGAKMPACNLAKLELMIHSDTGSRKVQHNLFLHSKTASLLSAFFVSIGQQKRGEPLTAMNWQLVTGAKGRAKIKINKYKGTDGREYINNEVVRFIEPENGPIQQTSSWQSGGGFGV